MTFYRYLQSLVGKRPPVDMRPWSERDLTEVLTDAILDLEARVKELENTLAAAGTLLQGNDR